MLSDLSIRRAQPGSTPKKISDGRGLHLLIRPNGSKLWQFRYRFEGKEKTASLGAYPDVSLSQARDRREELRRQVASGVDPVHAKKLVAKAKRDQASSTFQIVAMQWLVHWATNKHHRHVEYVKSRLEADVLPVLGKRPIAEITAPELVLMVKAIEARGALDIAKRSLQTCSQIFRYAIAHGIGGAVRNPATDIRPSDVIRPRTRQNFARVDAAELPALFRKIEAYSGAPQTRLAMKLMALTFVRTGELIGAKWAEFDLDQRRWNIPAERMKMREPHIVPLSTQAVAVLAILREISGHREILFPGERDHSKPMSNNTILAALKRMGYAGRMTGHGFRGVASTLLHEQGFDHQHIELQLAHRERNSVSAAYNHAQYLRQRFEMMQAWGDYLEALTSPNVISIRRAAA